MAGKKGAEKEKGQEKKAELKRRLAKQADSDAWTKKVGCGVLVVVVGSLGIFQFLNTIFGFTGGSNIATVDLADTALLKKVLFSGDPWLIYCINNETQGQRLPRVFEANVRNLKKTLGVESAIMSCWDKTESNRSVAERFKLSPRPPLSFVVANGNKPRMLGFAGINQYEQLEQRILPALALDAEKVDTLKKWGSLCTSRKSCIVIGYKNTAQRDLAVNIFRPLNFEYRSLKMVTLDTVFWQLKLSESLLETRSTEARGKVADVLCITRKDEPGKNTTYHGAFLKDLEADSAKAFVKSCVEQQEVIALDDVPKINARPSKVKVVKAPKIGEEPEPEPKKKVDRVGSRAGMDDDDDPLVETVNEDGEEAEDDDDDDSEINLDDEVEL